jgi:hypothetical protein
VLELDGKRLAGNPYAGVAERDSKEHELRVSADKYRGQRLALKLGGNVDLHLALQPANAGRPASAPRRTKPQPESSAPVPVRSAEGLEPGMDLRPERNERAKRAIDEKDPYAP